MIFLKGYPGYMFVFRGVFVGCRGLHSFWNVHPRKNGELGRRSEDPYLLGCGYVVNFLNAATFCDTGCHFAPVVISNKSGTPPKYYTVFSPGRMFSMEFVDAKTHNWHIWCLYLAVPSNGLQYLGGGFKYFSFSLYFGEDFQFDSYFSNGLVQPPTRYPCRNFQPGRLRFRKQDGSSGGSSSVSATGFGFSNAKDPFGGATTCKRVPMGVSENNGTPNLHPKMIIFSRKKHGCCTILGNPPIVDWQNLFFPTIYCTGFLDVFVFSFPVVLLVLFLGCVGVFSKHLMSFLGSDSSYHVHTCSTLKRTIVLLLVYIIHIIDGEEHFPVQWNCEGTPGRCPLKWVPMVSKWG